MNVLEKILEEMDIEIQKQRELCKDLEGTPGYRLYEKVASVFKGIITKHMDEVANDGWIPVSERLPDKSDYYIVYIYDEDVEEYDFRKVWFEYAYDYDIKESAWCELYNFERVVAWKPLPEPYKGGDKK